MRLDVLSAETSEEVGQGKRGSSRPGGKLPGVVPAETAGPPNPPSAIGRGSQCAALRSGQFQSFESRFDRLQMPVDRMLDSYPEMEEQAKRCFLYGDLGSFRPGWGSAAAAQAVAVAATGKLASTSSWSQAGRVGHASATSRANR